MDEIVEVGIPRAVADAIHRQLNSKDHVNYAQVAEKLANYEE